MTIQGDPLFVLPFVTMLMVWCVVLSVGLIPFARDAGFGTAARWFGVFLLSMLATWGLYVWLVAIRGSGNFAHDFWFYFYWPTWR